MMRQSWVMIGLVLLGMVASAGPVLSADGTPAKVETQQLPLPPAKKPVDAKKSTVAAKPQPSPAEIQAKKDREVYRIRLINALKQKEAIASVQEKLLNDQQDKLKRLYGQLVQLASAPVESTGDSGGGGDAGAGGETQEVSPLVKTSRSYDTETYRTSVIRQALVSTQRDIAQLNEFLKHIEPSK